MGPPYQATECFRSLKKNNLMLQVKISTADVGSLEDYEYIKPSSWIQYMDETCELSLIFGTERLQDIGDTLRLFWSRYEQQFPAHMVFQRAREGTLRLEQTLPMFIHADEGRTLKKRPLFLIQWQAAFGKGVGQKNTPEILKARLRQLRLQPNFKGHSFSTRFLCGLMLRSDYIDEPENLDALLELICEDLAMLGQEGIRLREGLQLWLAPLGNKGDWDYIAKVAHLTRTYRNCPKNPTSKSPDKPMCHLCLAGSPGFPYESVCLVSKWVIFSSFSFRVKSK